MLRKRLIGACALAAGLAQVASCSIDSREVVSTSAFSGLPGAGVDGQGNELAGGPAAPRITVEPGALDLGQAIVALPSRGRINVLNEGNAPFVPSRVAMLQGSDPDFLVLHDRCEGAVGASERCEVRVQFVPSEPGPSNATLQVEGSQQSAQVPLAGFGLEAGPLIVAPAAGSSGDFGGVMLGSSVEALFDVSNPMPDTSGPLTFALNEPQFQLLPPAAGDCQLGVTALANGQSCRLRVAFTPMRRGSSDALLVVTSPNLGSAGLSLAGAGRLPPALAAPDRVDFGNVVVGGAGLRTLRVENQGDEPLGLSGVALAGTGAVALAEGADVTGSTSAFSLQNSDCGTGRIIPGGGSCSITIAFRPQVAQPDQQIGLRLSAVDGTEKAIVLSGGGLPEGLLRITPAEGGSGDFGELTVGASATQSFLVTNRSEQPSGPIDLTALDDFALVPSSSEGDCQSGVTALVNGQSCSVAVSLTPTSRGQHDGALQVGSALAGGAYLPLTGRGLAVGRLEFVRSEIDFGRVPAQTPVQQLVTVQNTGDRPLAGLQTALQGAAGTEAVGFTIQSPCTGELASGATCNVGIQFLPADAAVYSAVLRLAGDSAVTSALLLGRAFPRGSLTLTPVDGSEDFGDVALGSPRTIQFTLENVGGAPSGRLTITSTNNLFTLNDGDCNLQAGTGLGSGESCTFGVTFNPTTSDLVSGNLSVQSPGAGETAVSLSGRGRSAPNLVATNNRDLGRANVNQEALREPANQFSWTVTNEGDLESGALQVTNSNAADFVVSNDTCNDAVVAGHGSCTMDIRFRPAVTGSRSSTVTVTDTVTSQVLELALTGTAVVLAQPGQSCVNAECVGSTCTGGVCCDRECIGSCQVCDASGVCIDQAERQACGNGNGECFGVNRCLLPETQPCTGDDQCGAGNCEQRLGGAGVNDRICCLASCAAGQLCNPQSGQCQVPTLAAGAACGAGGQPACGQGLACKACRGGGNQCTPVDGCCGGCAPGYDCINGSCGCPTGSNGAAQIDCGNGLCILNRANACCPATPDCPGNLPVCDGSVGLCRQCMQPSDCPPGPPGTVASCFNFTCDYACANNLRDCGNDRCVQMNQCCSSANCNPCQTCNGQSFCQDVCNPGEQCNPQNNTCFVPAVGFGQACNQQQQNCTAEPGLTCGSSGRCECDRFGPTRCNNRCVDTQIDEANCGGCNASCEGTCLNGSCQCPGGQVSGSAGCGLADGDSCNNGGDCASGVCTQWFLDIDGDDFGVDGPKACGLNTQPFGALSVGSYVPRGGDCCDIQAEGSRDVFPGAPANSNTQIPLPCQDADTPLFDHNCDTFND